MTHCQVTVCKRNENGRCPKSICSEYDLYRAQTGFCEICGSSMKDHPVCGLCGILVGAGHLEPYLTTYQDKKLCYFCLNLWQNSEMNLGKLAFHKKLK